MNQPFTVEELLSDNTFIDYCLNEQSVYRQKWNALVADDAALFKTAGEAKAMLTLISPSLSKNEIETEVNKLRDLIDSRRDKRYPARRRKTRLPLLIAAVVFIVALSAIPFLINNNAPTPTTSNFETKMGERKQYTLPDGSTIILNSNSRFSFNESFGQNDRQIFLEGDAFFKVAKNPQKPFIVRSGGFSTTAVGTAFYVHAKKAANGFSVDLLEGKVKLERNTTGEAFYLAPGQKALWKQNQSTFTRQSYDTLLLNKWIKGVLSFNNIPVNEAFAQIESWYAVEIEDRRKDPHVSTINGDYVNAPLDDVIKIICFSVSSTYHFQGNKIIIE